ncbi:DUF2892 domain-containing protein [Noviherbaspirillum agri]
MNANVGKSDKTIRLVMGVILLSLFFILEGSFKWIGLVGIVPLATALMNWCPLYTVFGMSTCKR